MKITINNIPKLSFNVYNHLHWTKKKQFKDTLRLIVKSETNNLKLDGGYTLDFTFYFKGKLFDKVNTVHYMKCIEDTIFAQDKDNGRISTDVKRGKTNYVEIELIKCKDI